MYRRQHSISSRDTQFPRSFEALDPLRDYLTALRLFGSVADD